MRKRLAICLSILTGLVWISALVLGQIIENPAEPLAKNAGRALGLSEVWRITDEGEDFYFSIPRNLQFATDGSILIADKEELLRFSTEGRFIKNIFRHGQGPGEINRGFIHFVQGNSVFIRELNSFRFWRADLEGTFQEQYDITSLFDPDFIGVVPEGFLFLTFVWPPRSEFTGKKVGVPHRMAMVARDGQKVRDILKFERQSFLAPHYVEFDPLIMKPSPDGKRLYVVNGWDYMIDVIDPVSGATIKKFTRRYDKVRYILTDEQKDERLKRGFPSYKFAPDIYNFFPAGERLWVETSTDDKAKGRLYDVFDKDCRFVDSFFLGAGKTLMAVGDGAVFCQEKRADETVTIMKYRVDFPP